VSCATLCPKEACKRTKQNINFIARSREKLFKNIITTKEKRKAAYPMLVLQQTQTLVYSANKEGIKDD
jgi:hypothetical protein